jgi:hypothetical protein
MSLSEPEAQLCQALQTHTRSKEAPAAIQIAEALQQVERTRRARPLPDYGQLLGTWRLVLVARLRSGQQPKPSAQRVPSWLPIRITYARTDACPDTSTIAVPAGHTDQTEKSIRADVDRGCVKNEVQLGLLTLTLTGPTVFYRNRNILAFDFTRLQLQLAGQVMYAGMIRGGAARDAAFYDLSLKEQAFFNFFWCDPQGIAARGKGGGLALWRRENTP